MTGMRRSEAINLNVKTSNSKKLSCSSGARSKAVTVSPVMSEAQRGGGSSGLPQIMLPCRPEFLDEPDECPDENGPDTDRHKQ